MGCDIHCHIEVKINGRWEHWSAPNIDRFYHLFGRMAGVRRRGGVVAIAAPRGMVTDPTIPTEIDWLSGDGDWHTPSWLTGAELDMLIKEMEPKEQTPENYDHPWASWRRGGFGYLFGNDFDVVGLARDGASHPDGVEDCRLVFWFDN